MLLNIGSHSSLPSRANFFGAPNKFSMSKTKWKVASWQLRQSLPTDGLPVLEDWLTVWEQMVFAGVDLAREPVDVSDPILEQLQMSVFNVLRFQIKTHFVTRSKWPQDWMLLQAVTCQYVDSCLFSTFTPNVLANTCQRTENGSQTLEHRHCEGLYEDPVRSVHYVAGQWFGPCNPWGTAAARTLFRCPGQVLACSSSCSLAQMIVLFEALG